MTIDVNQILKNRANQKDQDRYKVLNLNSNPFPKSGTANINESSEQTKALTPIDENVHRQVAEYIADSLYASSEEDQKLIGTITGDYGTCLLYTSPSPRD